ncbi:MAG: hypothetical protein AAGB33_00205, partial [Cellulomonas sp.]
MGVNKHLLEEIQVAETYITENKQTVLSELLTFSKKKLPNFITYVELDTIKINEPTIQEKIKEINNSKLTKEIKNSLITVLNKEKNNLNSLNQTTKKNAVKTIKDTLKNYYTQLLKKSLQTQDNLQIQKCIATLFRLEFPDVISLARFLKLKDIIDSNHDENEMSILFDSLVNEIKNYDASTIQASAPVNKDNIVLSNLKKINNFSVFSSQLMGLLTPQQLNSVPKQALVTPTQTLKESEIVDLPYEQIEQRTAALIASQQESYVDKKKTGFEMLLQMGTALADLRDAVNITVENRKLDIEKLSETRNDETSEEEQLDSEIDSDLETDSESELEEKDEQYWTYRVSHWEPQRISKEKFDANLVNSNARFSEILIKLELLIKENKELKHQQIEQKLELLSSFLDSIQIENTTMPTDSPVFAKQEELQRLKEKLESLEEEHFSATISNNPTDFFTEMRDKDKLALITEHNSKLESIATNIEATKNEIKLLSASLIIELQIAISDQIDSVLEANRIANEKNHFLSNEQKRLQELIDTITEQNKKLLASIDENISKPALTDSNESPEQNLHDLYLEASQEKDAQLFQLEKKIEELIDENTQSEDKILYLEEKILQLQTRIHNLEVPLHTTPEYPNPLDGEIDFDSSSIKSDESEEESEEKSKAELQEQLNQLRETLSSLKAKKADLELQLETAVTLNKTLGEKANELPLIKEQLKTEQTKNRDLIEKYNSQQCAIDFSEKRIEELERLNNTLTEQNSVSGDTLEKNNEELTRLKEEFDLEKIKLNDLNRQKLESDNKLDSLRTTYDKLLEAHETLTIKSKKLLKDFEELQKQVEKISDLETKVSDAETMRQEQALTIEQLTDDIEALKRTHEQKLTEQTEEHQRTLHKTQHNYQEKLDALSTAKELAIEKGKASADEVVKLQEKIRTLKNNHEQLLKTQTEENQLKLYELTKKFEADRTDLQLSLDIEKNKTEKLESDIQQLETQLSEVKISKQELERKVEEKRLLLKSANEQLAEKEKARKQATTEATQLKAQLQ